jgi:hypothetical protein
MTAGLRAGPGAVPSRTGPIRFADRDSHRRAIHVKGPSRRHVRTFAPLFDDARCRIAPFVASRIQVLAERHIAHRIHRVQPAGATISTTLARPTQFRR